MTNRRRKISHTGTLNIGATKNTANSRVCILQIWRRVAVKRQHSIPVKCVVLDSISRKICVLHGTKADDAGDICLRCIRQLWVFFTNCCCCSFDGFGQQRVKFHSVATSCLQHLFINNAPEAGVYHLTDAIDCMIQRGAKFQAFKVKNWFDCGKKESLLESNATLLKKFGGNTSETHNYPHTIIIPPVSIAPGCEISHSIIGPHVAIGANTHIQHSIVRDSIIGSYTHLFEVVLDNSLIGSDASVKGLSRSLNIGDNTEIDFG